jgi:hypothetical protein
MLKDRTRGSDPHPEQEQIPADPHSSNNRSSSACSYCHSCYTYIVASSSHTCEPEQGVDQAKLKGGSGLRHQARTRTSGPINSCKEALQIETRAFDAQFRPELANIGLAAAVPVL